MPRTASFTEQAALAGSVKDMNCRIGAMLNQGGAATRRRSALTGPPGARCATLSCPQVKLASEHCCARGPSSALAISRRTRSATPNRATIHKGFGIYENEDGDASIGIASLAAREHARLSFLYDVPTQGIP
jgi:hypothetical protein